MYNEKIETLIKAALADGTLTEKEKQVLFKRAQEEGIDLDEFEMVLDARLVELQKTANAATSAPKSTKYGDVRKCPTCGALVPALAVSCAECGFEFSSIEASSSAQTLSKKIAEIKETASKRKNERPTQTSSIKDVFLGNDIDIDANEQIISLVENFPVPNSKDDLFDLIMFLKGEDVYDKKYKECLNRAKLLYPTDPLFIKIMEQNKEEKKKNILITGVVVIVLIIAIIILLLLNNYESPSLKAEQDKAVKVMMIINMPYHEFQDYVADADPEITKKVFKELGVKSFDQARDLIESYVRMNDTDNAFSVCEKINSCINY